MFLWAAPSGHSTRKDLAAGYLYNALRTCHQLDDFTLPSHLFADIFSYFERRCANRWETEPNMERPAPNSIEPPACITSEERCYFRASLHAVEWNSTYPALPDCATWESKSGEGNIESVGFARVGRKKCVPTSFYR